MTPPSPSIKTARDSIYQREIMSLAKSQLGAGEIADADRRAHLHNPLCGDEIIVTAKLSAAEILDIAHKTRGCVLCLAAAAKMTSLAREIRSINQLIALANQIDLMIGGGGGYCRRSGNVFAGHSAHQPPRMRAAAFSRAQRNLRRLIDSAIFICP